MASLADGDVASNRSVVHRTVQVLQAFTVQPRWGVRELAAHLGVAKSGLHRTLQEMSAEGLLQGGEDGSYEVGGGLLRLAAELIRTTDITRVAHEYLVRSTSVTSETTILVAYDPQRQQIIAIESVESPKPIQYRGALTDWTDLHLSASGLGILAFLPPEDIRRYFGTKRLDVHDRPVTAESIEPTLREIRENGWSFTRGLRVPGTSGVCSPIFDGRGQPVAGIVIPWPDRPEPLDPAFFGRTCRDAAAGISAALGATPSELTA